VLSQQHRPNRIIFAAGGTAGHVEPALATADMVRGIDPTARISFLGTSAGIENRLVPPRGFDLHTVPKAAIPRGFSKDLILLPVNLIRAVLATRRRIAGADVVVGFGGYLAGTAYLAAKISGIPIIVHEANASAGLANRLGAHFTDDVALCEQSVGIKKGVVIGLPMREALVTWAMKIRNDAKGSKSEARLALGLAPEKLTLVVMGGSQGSLRINNAVADALRQLLAKDIQVLHSVGARNELPIEEPGYFPTAYLARVELAYAAADLLVARSGAATCQEALAFGLPAIFVPLPHGNGEQALNAAPLVEVGASVIISDEKLNGEVLADLVIEILKDDALLTRMRKAGGQLAHLDAAGELAYMVMKVASRRR